MANARRSVVKFVFVFSVFLILAGDYSGLLTQLFGGNRMDSDRDENNRSSARPANPGYGDTKTKLDLDVDIEDETLKNIGKYISRNLHIFS